MSVIDLVKLNSTRLNKLKPVVHFDVPSKYKARVENKPLKAESYNYFYVNSKIP